MSISRRTRSRTTIRTAAILGFFVLLAPFSFAQTITYNGRTAKLDEVLVRLKGTDSAALARVQAALPSATFRNLSPSLSIHLVRIPGLNFQTWLDVLARHSDVLYAEPNYVVQAVNTPNDPNYPLLWAMPQISAPSAWNVTTGGTSAVAGVVDTGIDYTHPDLAANAWSAPAPFTVTIAGNTITCPAGSHGFNTITNTCDPADDNSHGTHVSGTIGAVGNNNTGVAGVNWTARVMGLKFLDRSGSGSTSNAINAIEFAIQTKAFFAGTSTPVNVRVLSNSWGGSGFSGSLLSEINKANSNDILFVAAAGNNAGNNDTTPFYPASFSAPNVVAVAATDNTDTLASFSNYGASSVHLGAPGVNIYSTVPGGGYASYSGTSMATPHVSGAALLTLAACPSLNTVALKSALLNNVDVVSTLAGKTITGGRLDVYKAIHSCAPGGPTTIATYSGSPQSATVGTAFGSALQARVTDASANPVSGVSVTFTAPASGASATFSGSTTTTTVTNASGIATSPVPLANATAGTYSVTASVSGLTPAAFSLTNTSGTSSATTIFGSLAPTVVYASSSSVEMGVKFRSDVSGSITGIRFYKAAGDTSTHTGSLWSSTGTLLATGTFSGETTSGWQQMTFSAPVAIAPNTTYVATYHTNGSLYYSSDFFQSAGFDSPPLHALKDGVDGPNGIYGYGTGFPTLTNAATNYWADVLFAATGTVGPPSSVAVYSGTAQSATVGTAFGSPLQAKVTDASANPVSGVSVTFTAPASGASATFSGSTTTTAVTNASGIATSPVPIANGTAGTYSVTASVSGLTPATFSLTNTSGTSSATTIFGSLAPTVVYASSSSVEMGVKFRSDVSGSITGIRFYKAAGDTSTHTGSLWSSTGTLLATGTFSGETTSGWQQMTFSAPVAIAPNTTYVATYHTNGSLYYSSDFFQSAGFDSPPLHALKDGVDGPNGIYGYGTGFPTLTNAATNYWADVLFASTGTVGPPASVVAYSGTQQSAGVGSAFASALQAKVTDASANPVSGVSVTFTAPASGASATFSGSTTTTAITNASGIATSPVPLANATAGTYSVTASVSGLTPAAFSLTNTSGTSSATTIFGSLAPTVVYASSSSVEMGVKFRSDVSGSITGIRFYKAAGDTSTHTGSLWSSTGTLLATGTFSGETTSGWQQMTFSAPVAIAPNTTYVATYHTNGSLYYSSDFFQSAGFDSPPLHALKDGVDGPNGIYGYGTGFPTLTNAATNYWADVLFTAN